MSKRPSEQNPVSPVSGLAGHWSAIWFHVIGAALLTLPQLLTGGDNMVCTAWDAFNMAGVYTLGCASKTYLALLIGLSALWLTIFALPAAVDASSNAVTGSLEALSQTHQMAGLTARFAVFFAISMVMLESLAHLSQWVGPLTG